MVVMMIVRAAPDAARAQGQDAEDPHEHRGDARAGQNRVVLLIVVNDEKPQEQQAAQDAANGFSGEIEVPVSARQRRQEQNRRRNDVPPTLERWNLWRRAGWRGSTPSQF